MEVEIAKRLWELEKSKKELTEQIDKIKEEYDAKAEELMQYLLEEGKSSTGHIEGVGTFTLKRESYPSVTQANMGTFIEHVKQIGDSGIVKETVESATLKAYLKGKLEQLTEELEENETQKLEICSLLGLDVNVSSAEVAAKYWHRYGVSTFQKTKLSHTGKGK